MSSSPPTEQRQPRWRPSTWSLRTRLVTIMIALLSVLGLVVGGTAEIYLHRSLYNQLDDRLDEAQHQVSRGNRFNGGGFLPTEAPPPNITSGSIILFLDSTSTRIAGGLVQYQADAETAGPGSNEYADLPAAALADLTAVPASDQPSDVDLGGLGDYRVVSTVVQTQNRGPVTIVTALSLESLNSTLLQVAAFTCGVVLIALVVAGWAGAVIVRRTLLPLNRVAATASRVAELKLDRGEVQLAQRVPALDTDPRTEVGQVGAALNRMLDHVGGALEARHASEMRVRQFVADASHELRTPLAAIRGYAELSRRSRQPVPDDVSHVLTRVESEAKRMTTLVEDLLLLARLDASQKLAHEPVDLTMLVVDAVSDAHATGPGHAWKLDLPDEPVTVVGDGARLHQVLANLLANARTHTPEGTTVTVRVDGSGTLQVIDDGPGIQPELLPHIFERFARGDSSRSRAAGSTGLGLSIVHAVVTAHGGRVDVRSEPGRTVFTVTVPTIGQSAGSLPVAG